MITLTLTLDPGREPVANPMHLAADLPAVEFPIGTLHFGVV